MSARGRIDALLGERFRAEAEAPAEAFGRLFRVVARLRAPDGCPWDREQTPASLRGALIEEAYELVEAIDEGEPGHIAEEAGDLFLLATMVGYLQGEEGAPGVAEALDSNAEKLVRRHPHVFGEAVAETPDAVLSQWNDIKEKVEGRRRKDSLLDEVSKALPPLERAYRIQKKAAKVGFDWPAAADVWAKAREELAEAEEACEQAAKEGNREHLEEELGDLLYSAINLCRWLEVDPAVALHRTVEKFSRRFRHVEKRMAGEGIPLAKEHLARMDGYWNEAKKDETGKA